MAEKIEPTMEEKLDKAILIAKGILPSRTQKDDVQKVAQSVLNLAHVKALYDSTNPTEELNEELTFVLGLVRASLNGSELTQVTQAALNVMHAKQILTEAALKVMHVKQLLTEEKTTPEKQGGSA